MKDPIERQLAEIRLPEPTAALDERMSDLFQVFPEPTRSVQFRHLVPLAMVAAVFAFALFAFTNVFKKDAPVVSNDRGMTTPTKSAQEPPKVVEVAIPALDFSKTAIDGSPLLDAKTIEVVTFFQAGADQ